MGAESCGRALSRRPRADFGGSGEVQRGGSSWLAAAVGREPAFPPGKPGERLLGCHRAKPSARRRAAPQKSPADKRGPGHTLKSGVISWTGGWPISLSLRIRSSSSRIALGRFGVIAGRHLAARLAGPPSDASPVPMLGEGTLLAGSLAPGRPVRYYRMLSDGDSEGVVCALVWARAALAPTASRARSRQPP
jgi:hypothetical protein